MSDAISTFFAKKVRQKKRGGASTGAFWDVREFKYLLLVYKVNDYV
jgi:hypothetical protein